MKHGLNFWITRLPMSFLIIGLFLVWEIHRSQTGRSPALPPWRIGLYAVAAGLCAVMFVIGLRQRHRG